MKIAKLALSCSLILSLVGCASIAGNNSRAVNVTAAPAGAGIYVDNQQFGIAPATITLPNYIYGGNHDQTLMVNTQFQPIALLDIFLWPTFIIDAATGNLVKIDPATSNLNFKLQRA
jgi:hypothetical protein